MKIAVIGTGTVGVLSVCYFLGHTKDVEVICIHNPKKNILGMMPHPERMIDNIISNTDGVNLFSSLIN